MCFWLVCLFVCLFVCCVVVVFWGMGVGGGEGSVFVCALFCSLS